MNLLRCIADDQTPGPLLGLKRVNFVRGWNFWRGGDREVFPTIENLHAIADESVGSLTMLDIECWPEERLPDYVRISKILRRRQPGFCQGWFHGFRWCSNNWEWYAGREAIEYPYGYHAQHGMAEKYRAVLKSQRATADTLRGHIDAIFPGCYLGNADHLEMYLRFLLDKPRQCCKDFGCAVYPVLWPRHHIPPKYPTVTDEEWTLMLDQTAALEREGTTAGTVIWDSPKGLGAWKVDTPWVKIAMAKAMEEL